MARKNPFANVMTEQTGANPVALDYTVKGASRSIISTIDELAARADKLLEGETVVDLDPATVDVSFVQDRLEDDRDAFETLKAAIREQGQTSPILVRPHPSDAGRYMVVFGHRRLRVASELGRPVRAVVKAISDRDHVIAQGQENSARSDLSFIERARFAKRLSELNYDGDNLTVMTALSSTRQRSPKCCRSPICRRTFCRPSVARDRRAATAGTSSSTCLRTHACWRSCAGFYRKPALRALMAMPALPSSWML